MQRTTIERAFDLARSGECRTLDELKHRLRQERMESVDFHLAGKHTKSQLSELMARAPGSSVPAQGKPEPTDLPGQAKAHCDS